MILSIRQHKNDGETKIIVKYAKVELSIFEDSDDWNSRGINTFLINLASSIPNGDKIDLEFDDSVIEEDYKQIVMLFKSFANEYNSSINIDNSLDK